ncbi:hypothetical protein JWG42_13140 [Desulfoprunum benzoelyticum]|uniref:Tetratricopeptide (TPR) repeat protein n=1 Tax=Desulfoprunum benzoelyticum TaxID=1506996 RepID=A0A840UPM0_9BACT|nr:hypothetical protein [Desulfoprunum benzoelyticum]MBB5347585.1 tetratricopeptide (TPR) repeat protein [Desulfoprunum benzoelyticum]MBM9531097.1 hypothetical protein [Desulfoprunum benzoelyticum]
MHSDIYKDIAIKYHVEDLAGALIPGSRLSNILKELENGRSISNYAHDFLFKNALYALLRYTKNETNFAEFLKSAEPEQSARKRDAKERFLKEQSEQNLQREALQARMKVTQERIAAEKRSFDKSPKNKAKAKQFELRDKYNLSLFIDKDDYPKLMDILRTVDKGVRLPEEDFIWLWKNGNNNYRTYFTIELRERYHKNEAKFYAIEFENDKNPWSAVNASKHFRKCNSANKAVSLLSSIDVSRIKDKRLKSAIYTTYGGAKRDLMEWAEALSLGEQAHLLNPKSFHPCTLLGAVNIQTGNVGSGLEWYRKAEELGYNQEAIDDELRGIFNHLEISIQRELKEHLLNIDYERYDWTNDW